MRRKRDERPEGFVLYSAKFLHMLEKEELGVIFKAGLEYFLFNTPFPKNENRIVEMGFQHLKEDIDSGIERYKETCERNKRVAEKREENRKRKEQGISSPDVTSRDETSQNRTGTRTGTGDVTRWRIRALISCTSHGSRMGFVQNAEWLKWQKGTRYAQHALRRRESLRSRKRKKNWLHLL